MKEKPKKIFVNSKTRQMSIVLPKIKAMVSTLKFSNEMFDAEVVLKMKKIKDENNKQWEKTKQKN